MWYFRTILFLFLIAGSAKGACTETGAFELQLEYLYLKPSLEQSFYAISSTTFTTPDGSRKNNDPDFHSAFRLEGAYNFCNCMNNVSARFTYLNGSDKDRVDGEFLFNTQGFPGGSVQIGQPITGFIESDLHFKYYGGDFVFGQSIFDNCTFNLSLFGGVHIAYIGLDEDIFTFESTISFSNELIKKSHLWGIGPEIGFDFHYLFPTFSGAKFSLVGDVRSALLVNATHARFQFTTDSPFGGSTRKVQNTKNWSAVPVFDLRFGLNFEHAFRCFIANIEIGYEAISYRNAIQTIVFVDDTYPGNSIDSFSDLSFHGPYVALNLTY